MSAEQTPSRRGKVRQSQSCLDRALKILSLRDHAKAELRRKLVTAGHNAGEIDAAIERLSSLGYLDDARFASQRAKSLDRAGKLGRRAIANRLRQAGLGDDLVRRAMAELDAAHDDQNTRGDLDKARALLERRFASLPKDSDAKTRARAARFLASRGFSSEVIGRLIRFDSRD
ncbi:MAG: regulatory protein RecX [Myxococcaceae bacterium]|nr:regulatory protein RecX [Myxococcaceae bacterium]